MWYSGSKGADKWLGVHADYTEEKLVHKFRSIPKFSGQSMYSEVTGGQVNLLSYANLLFNTRKKLNQRKKLLWVNQDVKIQHECSQPFKKPSSL